MSDIKVGCITLGMLENNTYFLHREGEYDCILIDPAMNGENFVTKLREKGLTIKALLLTHAHFDHMMGVEGVRRLEENVLVYGSADDSEGFRSPELNQCGMINKNISLKLDREVKDGDEISVGSMKCKVISTPGHTIGSVCFYFEDEGLLFSGDTLFFESVGRTDFETGSSADLRRSLQKLFKLPPETKVYPGHHDFTTIGHETEYNPYAY
ncbi:MAG: MBL fold metallo-hydrolase [Lachnospiraceae bacterium]|nr:MBL fold metallo-hydrolase [Lachnospiraceae bacterium]